MENRFHSQFDGCLDIDPAQAAADLLKTVPSGKGILLFTDSADRPIQLLSSASMRAAAIARMAPQPRPVPTKRADLSAIIARIYYLSTFCDLRSLLRYRDIAASLYPADYRKMMNFARLSLVRIDLAEQWPDFSVTQRPTTSPQSHIFGPFPTHKSSIAFAQGLNHAFLLCRNPSLAIDPEKARSCPYLQMNTCPAPCVGRMTREHYLQHVDSAIGAASGQHTAFIETFKEQMHSLAAGRRFEEANQAKLSLAALQPLADPAYRWTTDLSQLAVLCIDRSRKVKTPESRKLVQSYAAFVIRLGHIDELPDFTDAELPATLEAATSLLTQPCPRDEPFLTDSILLLESFLYRSTPPGIFLDMREPVTVESVTSLLTQRFAKPDHQASGNELPI